MRICFESYRILIGDILVRKQVSIRNIHLRSLTSYYVTSVKIIPDIYTKGKLKGIKLLGLHKQ
jgi:hypothetical protein